MVQPKKVKFAVKKQSILTDQDALRYLTTIIFKNQNS
jgi:hypothetical protein